MDSSFVSHTVMACWMMVLIGDLSLDCRCSVKIKVARQKTCGELYLNNYDIIFVANWLSIKFL